MISTEHRADRPDPSSSAPPGRAAGPLVGAVFGVVWCAIGVAGVHDRHAGAVRVAAVLAAAAVLVTVLAAGRRAVRVPAAARRAESSALRPGFVPLIVVQAVLIGVGCGLLNGALGRPHLVFAWTALVVGAHFFPLSRTFRTPGLRVLGGAMVLLALVTGFVVLLVPDAPEGLWQWLPGLGTAALVWLAALLPVLRPSHQPTT